MDYLKLLLDARNEIIRLCQENLILQVKLNQVASILNSIDIPILPLSEIPPNLVDQIEQAISDIPYKFNSSSSNANENY